MTLIDVPARSPAPSWTMVCVAGCLGLLGAVLFAGFPQIDIAFSRLFYGSDGRFLLARPGASFVRELFSWLFLLACAVASIGFLMIAFTSRRPPLQTGFAAWLYLVLCLGIGPGLVANLLFKDQWGRPRPIQVVEFGGPKPFTPALTRSDRCGHNCSFVSGEASSYFAIGFAIALLADVARRRRIFLATLALGSLVGLIRIGAGGHFLSDVFFAAIFMAFVARALYWLLFERFEAFFADEGPLHRRTLHAGRRGNEQAVRLMERARASRLAERMRTIRRRQPPPAS
jgi:lipid A 4'-phosphatase